MKKIFAAIMTLVMTVCILNCLGVYGQEKEIQRIKAVETDDKYGLTTIENTTKINETTNETTTEETTEATTETITEATTEATTETTTEATTETITEMTSEIITETTTESVTDKGGNTIINNNNVILEDVVADEININIINNNIIIEGNENTNDDKAKNESKNEKETKPDSSNVSNRRVSGAGGKLTVRNYKSEDDTETTTVTATAASEYKQTKSTENIIKVQAGSDIMTVNNSKVYLDASPYINNGAMYVPLRALSSALNGCQIYYDPVSKSAFIAYNNDIIKFTAWDKTAYKNARTIILSSPAQIKNGRMFVPFRAVGDAFELEVLYENDTKTAIYREIV